MGLCPHLWLRCQVLASVRKPCARRVSVVVTGVFIVFVWESARAQIGMKKSSARAACRVGGLSLESQTEHLCVVTIAPHLQLHRDSAPSVSAPSVSVEPIF